MCDHVCDGGEEASESFFNAEPAVSSPTPSRGHGVSHRHLLVHRGRRHNEEGPTKSSSAIGLFFRCVCVTFAGGQLSDPECGLARTEVTDYDKE